MEIQQVAPPGEVPVTGVTPERTGDSEDIFCSLFLMALIGGNFTAREGPEEVHLPPSLTDPMPYHQDIPSSSLKSISSEDSRSNETFIPLRGTKEHENRWEQEETWVPDFSLDRGLRLKPGTQQGFSCETFISQGLTKDNENRCEGEEMWVPGFSLDKGLRLKPNTQQGFSGERLQQPLYPVNPQEISFEGTNLFSQHRHLEKELYRFDGLDTSSLSLSDDDFQNVNNIDSDHIGDRRWIDEMDVMTSVARKPFNSESHHVIQPLYKYIDQEGMIQHLSQRILHASHLGTHSARIRLKPDELGELCLDISVIDNNVKAFIAVENNDVKEMIESNLNRLEEELKNHGLRIEQFSVEITGGGPRDRFMSSAYREDAVQRRGIRQVSSDRSVPQVSVNISVNPDRGVINIFA